MWISQRARSSLLVLALTELCASATSAQEHALPAPTAQERAAKAAVVLADYRFDDMLWENDRIAFRIYGRALEAAEPPSSSGIDAWGKRVRWSFMDRQLRMGDQHSDYGEGLDFYQVGTGRGIGGLGIWYDNKLWTSRNYARAQILTPGPQVADFRVEYDPWPVDTVRNVQETRRFTLPAGTNFTRLTSLLTSSNPDDLIVGIGISKRPMGTRQLGEVRKNETGARISWWGPADGDKGRMAGAVMVDPAAFQGFAEDADNYLVLVRVRPGQPFVYYAGAAWDRGADFHTREEWEAYVTAQTPDFGP